MNELRNIKKELDKYENIIQNDPENIRKQCKIYADDIELLYDYIEKHIASTSEILQVWCEISVENFMLQPTNIFLKIKRNIDMKIINHYLNKMSGELALAGILRRKTERIKTRLIQYQYFCNN